MVPTEEKNISTQRGNFSQRIRRTEKQFKAMIFLNGQWISESWNVSIHSWQQCRSKRSILT